MEDMTESGTSDEEFKKQFGTCCGGTMSNTNIMEKSQCIWLYEVKLGWQ